MRKKVSIAILLGFFWIVGSNCVDTYDAQVSDDVSKCLVVNGNIISDTTVVISLSRTFSLNEETPPWAYDEVNADVWMVGADGTCIKGVPKGKGKYEITIGKLDEQVCYGLEIKYEGDIYTSKPQLPIKTAEITELTFEQPEEYGDIHINLTTSNSEIAEPSYYIWAYEEDWEVRTEYYSKWFYNLEENRVEKLDKALYAQGWTHHDSDKTLVGSTESNVENILKRKRIYSIASNDIRMSFYYSTLMKQRNVSRREFEYYQCKAKLNEEMGGLFTPQPSDLPTNISCDNANKQVIGYVGVNMNICERRLYISTDEIQYRNPLECWSKVPETTESMESLYEQGLRIVYFDMRGYHWGPRACVDYRVLGGTPDKPSFWPLPDREY